MGVYGKMCHGAISDVFAIAQCQTLEIGTPNYCAYWRGVLCLLLYMLMSSRAGLLRDRRLRDNPSHDTRQEVIANLPAIREIDFLEMFGIVCHLKHSIGSYIPNALHFPGANISTALCGKGSESFVSDVETIAYVDCLGAFADKWDDHVGESFVGHFAIVA